MRSFPCPLSSHLKVKDNGYSTWWVQRSFIPYRLTLIHCCYCPKIISFLLLKMSSVHYPAGWSTIIIDLQSRDISNAFVLMTDIYRDFSNPSCLGMSLRISSSPDASNTRSSAKRCCSETTRWLAGKCGTKNDLKGIIFTWYSIKLRNIKFKKPWNYFYFKVSFYCILYRLPFFI